MKKKGVSFNLVFRYLAEMTARRMICKTGITGLEVFLVLKSETVGFDLESHFSKPLKAYLVFPVGMDIRTPACGKRDSWRKN